MTRAPVRWRSVKARLCEVDAQLGQALLGLARLSVLFRLVAMRVAEERHVGGRGVLEVARRLVGQALLQRRQEGQRGDRRG